MKATIKYDAGASISVRLFDPSISQWYTGTIWSGTEGSAELQALTEKAIADPDYSRYSKNITSWPTGDYIVEYVDISTSEVIGEEVFVTQYDVFEDTTAILADTNELQIDWANGGRLDLILDTRASQTSVDDLPTNAELATALGTADDAVLAQVALVKAKTDLIPNDPADASDIAASFSSVNSSLSAIAGYIDTEISAIKAKTDLIPSDPADQSAVEAAITAAISGLNDISVSDILAGTVDGTLTIAQAMMVCASALVGNVTGGGTDTIVIKGAGNTTTRITAVVDENGNRTVTLSMV